MNIQDILSDKAAKPKEKTETLSAAVLDNAIGADDLLAFAREQKDSARATCIEVMEYVTRVRPEGGTAAWFDFVTEQLGAKAPRVKWESAKVIGNTAHLFPEKLDRAVEYLLANTEDGGTVVRWSAAFALGEILKLKTPRNGDLVPAVQAIMEREEKNSIRKIYADALKKSAR